MRLHRRRVITECVNEALLVQIIQWILSELPFILIDTRVLKFIVLWLLVINLLNLSNIEDWVEIIGESLNIEGGLVVDLNSLLQFINLFSWWTRKHKVLYLLIIRLELELLVEDIVVVGRVRVAIVLILVTWQEFNHPFLLDL